MRPRRSTTSSAICEVMRMPEIIADYWMQWLCGIAATALLAFLRNVYLERKALEAGVMALLHDRIWQAHAYYTEQGFCSLNDKKNVEYLYKPYAALHGNGTGKDAYEEICDLPTQPPERNIS